MARSHNVVHFHKNSLANLEKFPKCPDFTISEGALDLYKQIEAIANEVFLRLGDCYREEIYTQALAYEIRALDYEVETEVECDVLYKDTVLGKIRADLVAKGENSFIIESKRLDYYKGVMQLVGYMKSLSISVGFTIGFRKEGAKVWCALADDEGTMYMYDGTTVRKILCTGE
jgi:GxxExxY protein